MTVRSPIDVSPPHRPSREYRVYPALIERCAALEPIATAIAHPCDESSLQGAIEAAKAGLIRPILIGPETRIRAVAGQCGHRSCALPGARRRRTVTPQPSRRWRSCAPARPRRS